MVKDADLGTLTVFMDIEMQVLNGLESTKRIRQLELPSERVPIIAVSAHTEKEKKLLAPTSGFDDYLTKPVDQEQLNTICRRWLTVGNQCQPVTRSLNSTNTSTEINIQIQANTKVVVNS